MRFGVEPNRTHEAQRLGDSIGDALIAFGLRAILDEAKHPAMCVLEVRVAAACKGPKKIEGRGGLAIGLQLPARIGLTRLRRELDVVDYVSSVAWQRDAIDRLEV